jgi:hypothetical protein
MPMAARRKLVKMHGPAAWLENLGATPGQISRAILHEDKRLVIDLECEGYKYSITLERRSGDLFEGSWSCQDAGMTYTGAASGRLYSSPSSEFFFEDWTEEGTRFQWWAELCIVKHFPDES